MVTELKVRLHCKSCEKAVRRTLCKIKGVTCVETDVISNKVTVMGYVDRKVVVKAVWKTGRRAEFCRSSDSEIRPPPPPPQPRLHSFGFRCFIPKWVS